MEIYVHSSIFRGLFFWKVDRPHGNLESKNQSITSPGGVWWSQDAYLYQNLHFVTCCSTWWCKQMQHFVNHINNFFFFFFYDVRQKNIKEYKYRNLIEACKCRWCCAKTITVLEANAKLSISLNKELFWNLSQRSDSEQEKNHKVGLVSLLYCHVSCLD